MRSEDVARAVALNDDGRDIRYIANVLGRARSTIHDAVASARLVNTCDVQDREELESQTREMIILLL